MFSGVALSAAFFGRVRASSAFHRHAAVGDAAREQILGGAGSASVLLRGRLVLGFDLSLPRLAGPYHRARRFIGAVGLVAVKRVRDLEPLELQAWLAWANLPFLLPLTFLLESGQLESLRQADLIDWSALFYSAVLASLFAHTAYFGLIRRYPVSSVAPVTVLSPLFSVLFSVLLLGDLLDWRMVAGGLMTLSGVAVIVTREGRPAATTS